MNDFRLSVFLSVARHLSFTKAAEELNISQPAISKHIVELESGYGIQLFERSKSKVSLTPSGKIFKNFAQDIAGRYKELEFEMNLLSHHTTGEIVLGASTTIAQYVLPRIISRFMARFPEVRLSLVTGNSAQIEGLVSSNQIDLGLVEGASHKKEFHYTTLCPDELVLVTGATNKTLSVTLETLKTLPLVLRENGSGTLEVIRQELKNHGINFSELNILIQLGSSEAIKRYIIEGGHYAIVSVAAVADEIARGELSVVTIEGLRLLRDFCFISQVGTQNRLGEKFANFALNITKSYKL